MPRNPKPALCGIQPYSFITAKLSRSSAPRAALQLQGPISSGGFRETWAARQDSMATLGNFGGGSTGPDQIFLGITMAPRSAPGRGRAPGPVRRNPNPQTTEHERQTRAARSFEGFLFSKAQEVCVSLGSSVPTQLPSSAFDSLA
jgi:hypothetical protein